MRSTPWFHQRRSESAPPVDRPRDPPSISSREQDEITDRISRPTESALYRKSLYWKLDSFMDRGFHSWSKMDLFDDCKRCMWTQDGAIKRSCKIRPLQSNTGSLPPLRNGRSGSRGNGAPRTYLTSQSLRDSLSTPKNGNGNGHSENGSATCRKSLGGENGYTTTNNRAALANGLAMLGGVSGSRFRLHLQRATNKHGQYPASVNSFAVPRMGERLAKTSTIRGQ